MNAFGFGHTRINCPISDNWGWLRPKTVDLLIANGFLQRSQRHDWCAVQMAFGNAFYTAVSERQPDLDLQEVIEDMLRHPATKPDAG